MTKRNIHVSKHDNGWKVKKEGSSRASNVTNTQEQAIRIARNIAINQKCEVVIHGRDGKIRDKDSYGNDPYPPKDYKH